MSSNFSPNVAATNFSFFFQSNFINKNTLGISFQTKNNDNNLAYYAKKGEPMYMKEMDEDEDGIVSFDEFKDYCEENGISTKEMMKMVEMANAYRTMQAQKKSSKELSKQNTREGVEEIENEAIYAKRGDGKYDEAMDANNDDKVSYKEYIEYCKENSKQNDKKTDTTIEESEEGEFKTKNIGEIINKYTKCDIETQESKINDMA